MTESIKSRIEMINRGEVPDGYKKTKIGIMPSEWHEIHLKSKFERVTRKNTEGNTNVLTISAQHGLISQEDFFNKSVASDDKSNYYLLYKGEFAYNKSYSNGYPYGAIKRLERYDKGVVSPLYICLATKSNNRCPEFYMQYFEAGLMNREIQAFAQEGARNHGLLNIAVNDYFNSYILEPPLPEQEKIAKILTTCDKVIELKEKLIAEKQRQKKYLMQNLLTGKKRLDGFTGEWKKKPLGYIAEIVTGTTPATTQSEFFNGGYLWATPTDISNNKYLSETERTLSECGIKHGRFVPKGSLLVTCIASIGKIAILTKDGSCNQQINAVLPNENINIDYLYYVISNNTNVLHKYAGKSATPIINKETFSNFVFSLPSLPEQTAIASILSTADKEIELMQKGLDQWKQKKKTLMQLLLTGKVRVK